MKEEFDWSSYPPSIYNRLTPAEKEKIIINIHTQLLVAWSDNPELREKYENIIAKAKARLCLLGETL